MIEDGIIYLDVKDFSNIENFIEKLHSILSTHKNTGTDSSTPEFADKSRNLFLSLINILKDMDLLIILDDCDKLVQEDYVLFKQFLQNILEKTHKLTIIIGTMIPLTGFNNVNEK
jgi:hypothetical protein